MIYYSIFFNLQDDTKSDIKQVIIRGDDQNPEIISLEKDKNEFWTNKNNPLCHRHDTTKPFYYKYSRKSNDSKKSDVEPGKYRSLVFYSENNYQNLKVLNIYIYDKWNDANSVIHPVMAPILVDKSFFYFSSTTEENLTINENEKIALEKINEQYKGNFPIENKTKQSNFPYNFEIFSPPIKIKQHLDDHSTNCILARDYKNEINPNVISVYVPLVSFKSHQNSFDVGTFSSIKLLIDLCSKCGINQLLIDIEKVNNDLTFDPVHVDIEFNQDEMTNYDIDSIRRQKLKSLSQEYKSVDYDEQYGKFLSSYNKYFNEDDDGLIKYCQFKCIKQLHDSFAYACSNNISLATVIYNDDDADNLYKKVLFTSLFSHSVYICSFNQKEQQKLPKQTIDNILDLGVSVFVDRFVENFAPLNPSLVHPEIIENSRSKKSFVTCKGPNFIDPSMATEFGNIEFEEGQSLILGRLEEPEANAYIFYLTDFLLYFDSSEKPSGQILQPIRCGESDNDSTWRFLYGKSLDEILEDKIIDQIKKIIT